MNNLPADVCALIACYIGEDAAGTCVRKLASNCHIKYQIGDKSYCNGVLHSVNDRPSNIDGIKVQWHKHGVLHRDGDRPAAEYYNGAQVWCQNGQIMRDGDKPAVILGNGAELYFKDGTLHRDEDKPAWILNKKLEYIDEEGHRGGNYNITQKWYRHGRLHREGDPAVVRARISEWWYGGVFKQLKKQKEEWWIDGKFIREDGQYIIRPVERNCQCSLQ